MLDMLVYQRVSPTCFFQRHVGMGREHILAPENTNVLSWQADNTDLGLDVSSSATQLLGLEEFEVKASNLQVLICSIYA